MEVWALGTKIQVQEFIDEIERIKEEYHGTVGVDAVYNGLDEAINEARKVMSITKDFPIEECPPSKSHQHDFRSISRDGTQECIYCNLRTSNSE